MDFYRLASPGTCCSILGLMMALASFVWARVDCSHNHWWFTWLFSIFGKTDPMSSPEVLTVMEKSVVVTWLLVSIGISPLPAEADVVQTVLLTGLTADKPSYLLISVACTLVTNVWSLHTEHVTFIPDNKATVPYHFCGLSFLWDAACRCIPSSQLRYVKWQFKSRMCSATAC